MENENVFTKGARFEIYVGLKDKDSYTEIITTEEFQKLLAGICTKDSIAFSLTTQMGGYTHNKGYTTETSLRIDLIGAEEDLVSALGEKLKRLVNTDTILITRSEVEYAFI